MRLVVSLAAVSMFAFAAPPARAGGVGLDAATARAIGRAGAITVSDSTPTALAHNPAGIARRSVRRVQIGTTVRDGDVIYAAGDGTPTIENRAPPVTAPVAGIALGWGRVVVAAAYVEFGDTAAATDEPAFNRPPDEVSQFFPHRYGGTSLRATRRTVAAGIAVRATPSLAIGASATAARVEVAESRYIWSGFDGVDTVGDPLRDLRLSVDASDGFVPGATVGLLVVPETIPFELAVAATWSDDATIAGDARLAATRAVDAPRVVRDSSAATATLASPLALRTGLRYVGDRLALELGAELTKYLSEAATMPTWRLGLELVDRDTLPPVALAEAPSVIALRDHAAIRGAVDYAIVREFAWLTAGYAYRTAGGAETRINTAFADQGGHTVAVGAEGYWNDITIAVGFSRTLARSREVTSGLSIVNPTGGGTSSIGSGRYQTASDSFGISLELAWDDLPPLE